MSSKFISYQSVVLTVFLLSRLVLTGFAWNLSWGDTRKLNSYQVNSFDNGKPKRQCASQVKSRCTMQWEYGRTVSC